MESDIIQWFSNYRGHSHQDSYFRSASAEKVNHNAKAPQANRLGSALHFHDRAGGMFGFSTGHLQTEY